MSIHQSGWTFFLFLSLFFFFYFLFVFGLVKWKFHLTLLLVCLTTCLLVSVERGPCRVRKRESCLCRKRSPPTYHHHQQPYQPKLPPPPPPPLPKRTLEWTTSLASLSDIWCCPPVQWLKSICNDNFYTVYVYTLSCSAYCPVVVSQDFLVLQLKKISDD